MPWGSRSILANCLTWNEGYQASCAFFESDPVSITVRYEDLVSDTEAVLSGICRFITEPFERRMLDTSESGRLLATPNEPWKSTASEPVNASRLYGWRTSLSPEMIAAATLSCFPGLQALGYEAPVRPTSTLPTYGLTRAAIEKNESFVILAARRGFRLVRCREPLAPSTLLVLLDRTSLQTVLNVTGIVARRWLARRTTFVYDVPGQSRPIHRAIVRCIQLMSRPLA
jgi:hypothetical protein